MRFLKSLLGKQSAPEPPRGPAKGPISDAEFRRNVARGAADGVAANTQRLAEKLAATPPAHPGDLFYVLGRLSHSAMMSALIDWQGGIDPRPRLAVIPEAYNRALAVRPDILVGHANPGLVAVLSGMLGWGLPFETAPPPEEERKFALLWLDRWVIAGLASPDCWPAMATATPLKGTFIAKTLGDYRALLTGEGDPQVAIRRCIANFERRATHPAFTNAATEMGPGRYNMLSIDVVLATIMKQRGLVSGTVHDWVWD
ncbi:MAG: hypothetical protein NBV68_00535 [Erythrobacter sp.]|uniref:hypothetical protein n=1 Tax=Erythrobacter sp. TaxID=1042 RepID=UPI0025EFB6DB|nr:hypothetical protein [Erythrobacter sp.]MCL9997844.1 hypothetical protein [Erythrobacter sp.]